MPYIILYMILEAYTTWKLLTEHAPSRTWVLSQKQSDLPTASTAKCFISDLSRPLFTSGFAIGSASAPPKISAENPSPHQITLQ